ncbi:hypothetical protein [Roseinatronobacter bogoriensis]|uniref:hypothetical protein n=1 Tax=Roseinatronobacter bogoriensis TaxID=119542 RepID=UPI00106372C6|nr:hypothetical protein [Rhodobaca]MBB4208773.1 hypothetical protein [Rhodobaca bogoriensis DSM 18756]TDW37959.1 hypothetical protein LY39_02313 [Rhodobaca barguzinensis]TDY69871.1 hypothetical protein EV660_103266 [Rhodobaca bogoriensis DSM 18756]
MRLLLALSAALLAACASPQDRCLQQAQAPLVELDARIAESEHAIARGYRIMPATEARTTLHICAWPKEPVLFCTRHTPATRETRVAVDTGSEQANLDRLRAERSAVAEATAQRVASCNAV